ncbi:unnamed protein product [Ectocarpus sp. 13 AM-2016]
MGARHGAQHLVCPCLPPHERAGGRNTSQRVFQKGPQLLLYYLYYYFYYTTAYKVCFVRSRDTEMQIFVPAWFLDTRERMPTEEPLYVHRGRGLKPRATQAADLVLRQGVLVTLSHGIVALHDRVVLRVMLCPNSLLALTSLAKSPNVPQRRKYITSGLCTT